MKVILLERNKHLGELGAEIDVKPGYARNFLLPQGKAVVANKSNVAYFEERRAELEAKEKAALSADQARAQQLQDLEITMTARASEEGKLFGSIGAKELAAAISAKSVEVSKQEISLPEGPFRSIGEYTVELHLHHGEVVATIKLLIVNE